MCIKIQIEKSFWTVSHSYVSVAVLLWQCDLEPFIGETGKRIVYSWGIEIEEDFVCAGKRSVYELEICF